MVDTQILCDIVLLINFRIYLFHIAIRKLVKFRETGPVDDADLHERREKLSEEELLGISDSMQQSSMKLRKLGQQPNNDLVTAQKSLRKNKTLPI